MLNIPSSWIFKFSKDYIGVTLLLGTTLVIVILELFGLENLKTNLSRKRKKSNSLTIVVK